MKERKGVEAEEMARVQFGGSNNILIINIYNLIVLSCNGQGRNEGNDKEREEALGGMQHMNNFICHGRLIFILCTTGATVKL